MNIFKTWFDAKEIPIFALARNVKVKSEKSGTFTITSFDEIITSDNISRLRNQIPAPVTPSSGERKEMFDWRFSDDDGMVDEASVVYDDSPSGLAGESTDMDVFGENHIIFWIVPADEKLLSKAMIDALNKLSEEEDDQLVLASMLLDEYISRIYFVQHELSMLELHAILEESLNSLMVYMEEKYGAESAILREFQELVG